VPNLVNPRDEQRFRLMYRYRDAWLPLLEKKYKPEKKATPRREILKQIDAIRRPKAEGEGSATIMHDDAVDWLRGFDGEADLLLTDPPYSTDVDDIRTFAPGWLSVALTKLKPTGRALIFIGAYADEFAAYFSCELPEGWCFGVPHAWVYRNTIGPTPDYDFARNWQCVLSIIGPEADKLQTDRITDLLAGFVENAPDGRQEIKHHRWQKPLPLLQRFVRVTTNPEDLVIDPFAGSGSSLLAAKAEGRHAIGCDADQAAVEACIERGCYVAAN
jgi:DNA modification methylase